MSAAVATPVRTFYSRAAHLNFYAGRPKRIESDGQKQVEDGKMVQFNPVGDGWGIFITEDPELIQACERRGDVVEPEVYNRESIPAEQRAQMAEGRLSSVQRELEEKNRLIEKLEAESKRRGGSNG